LKRNPNWAVVWRYGENRWKNQPVESLSDGKEIEIAYGNLSSVGGFEVKPI
jgi:hypothetical protein